MNFHELSPEKQQKFLKGVSILMTGGVDAVKQWFANDYQFDIANEADVNTILGFCADFQGYIDEHKNGHSPKAVTPPVQMEMPTGFLNADGTITPEDTFEDMFSPSAPTAAPAAAAAAPAAVPVPNFLAIAEAAIARGETRILPIHVGDKNPIIKWAHLPIHNANPAEWATLYAEWIRELAAKYPNANACTVARSDEYLYIDEDMSQEFRQGYEAFTGESFPRTHTTSARENRCQSGWLQTNYSRAKLWNIVQGKTRDQMFSLRFNNMYVLAEGSVHKTGTLYAAIDNSPLTPIPDRLVDYILSCVVNATGERANRISEESMDDIPSAGSWFETFSLDEPFIHGNIDNLVKDFIWYYIKARNISNGAELFQLIEDHFEANGCYEVDGVTEFNWDREKIRAKCHAKVKSIKTTAQEYRESINKALAEAADVAAKAIKAFGELPKVQPQNIELNQTPDASKPTVLLVDPTDSWPYTISPDEFEAQADLEFPVYPLKPGAGPTWDDDIMYGIAGDIVRKAGEYCEAHPAGMYLDLLVSFGSLVGRGPYFNISSTQHRTNEFMVRVGDSSTSRKGTGRDAMNEILRLIDPNWYQTRVMSGFGSAQAIVNEIRDEKQQSVRKRNKNEYETITVPGVPDKRLMIREGELASIFQLAGQPNSIVDVVLRDGWDSNPLRNLVKGVTGGLSNSNSCQFPHISISADTTRNELILKMPAGAESNGFGNRFLYCFVRRVKLCPNGGPRVNWIEELNLLSRALVFSRDLEYVGMQKAANAVWNRMYLQIEQEATEMHGLAASMTARAAAHVRRLALILALMNGKDCIETEHLHAAKRMWDYCQDSARYIFSGLTKDQEIILGWIKLNGPVTVAGIREKLCRRNRKADWVRLQVNGLVQANRIVVNGDQITALG